MHQGGEVVRPHVEQRPAAGLIVERRVRVPGFRPAPHHEGGAGHRLAHRAVVDQLAHGLVAAAEERVRGAAGADAGGVGGGEHPLAFGHVQAKGLLAVDVLAGGDGGQIHFRMGGGNGEVEHGFDVVAPEQLVHRDRRHVETLVRPLRRFGVDVRAGDEIQHAERLRRAQVGGADGAAANEADANRLHQVVRGSCSSTRS